MCPRCNGEKIDSQEILCKGCVQVMPLMKFTIEMVERWRNNEDDVYCKKCEKVKGPRQYKYCAGKCQRQWLISAFADNELSQENGVCIRCMQWNRHLVAMIRHVLWADHERNNKLPTFPGLLDSTLARDSTNGHDCELVA